MSVEEIQDEIENTLINRFPDVAKKFIIYRYNHKVIRENKDKLIKGLSKKLMAKDIENQNANVDEYSFGGRIGEASRIVTKDYALNYCMSRKSRKNHLENEIYIHDLDSYAVGMHNCCKRDTEFITDNGVFSKNHVDIATSFLLKTIYNEVKGEVLDVGCGYGVIGITVAKNSNVQKVTMLDVNHRALELAKRNCEKNKVVNKVKILESDGFENIVDKYDTIITNPPIRAGKTVIYKMYEDAKEHLKDSGALYLVINKKHGAPSTITFLNTLFGNCEVLDKKTGFNVIRCVK
jgi:16S rRNA (guanine1207-N2)-methyltransferase